MLTNIDQQFAQVRDELNRCAFGTESTRGLYDALAALSVIERHVQDMERETRCEKCGTDDVLVRWHERRPSNRQAACRDDMSVLDYGKRPEEKKEHLHYHCRRCQFDWTAPVRAALPAREKGTE